MSLPIVEYVAVTDTLSRTSPLNAAAVVIRRWLLASTTTPGNE